MENADSTGQAIDATAEVLAGGATAEAAQRLATLVWERMARNPVAARAAEALRAAPEEPARRRAAAETLRIIVEQDPEFAGRLAMALGALDAGAPGGPRTSSPASTASAPSAPPAVPPANAPAGLSAGPSLPSAPPAGPPARPAAAPAAVPPVPTAPPGAAPGGGRRRAVVLAAVVALVVLLGAGAFHLFSDDGDSADEARLQAEARKVTLDFWRSYALHDFDTACRLVVPGARFMGKPRFPVCEDPEERREYERREVTDRLRAEVERLEVRSVELLGDSRARVVIGYGEYMETTLTRRGDRWLVAATERARP